MSALRAALRERSELGVAALLGALAVVIFIDTATMKTSGLNVGVLGPRVVPTIIASGLLLCAILLAVDVLRGGHGKPEDGEDIDLNVKTDWRTLLGLCGVIAGAAVLILLVGFPIAGAALFYGAALILGSRRYILAAIGAVILSVAVFYGFVVGLGIPLPAGVLKGIL